MDELLPYLVLAGAVAAVMGLFAWLAAVIRRRGGSGFSAAMAAYEEAFRVTAHDSHHEIRAQARRKAPAPSPDDPPGGRVGRRGGAGPRGSRRPRGSRGFSG